MKTVDYLVYDVSNILYRTFFANTNQDVDISTGLANHTALTSINAFYKKFRPKKVILAFDGYSWRKDYTSSDKCLSKKKYKGTRRQKMTPKEQKKYEKFREHVEEFEQMMSNHTAIPCLKEETLEADDLISGFCQYYGEVRGDTIIILSRDRDLTQLLGYGKDELFPNIRQIDPTTGELITLESAIKKLLNEKKELPEDLKNVDFYMFLKCIRGDASDNVQSSYPGIRKPRIIEAWRDGYKRLNLLNETWQDEEGDVHVVRALYNEANHLMNLREQPDDIKLKIFNTIAGSMKNPGKFAYIPFLQYLEKYEMRKIMDDLERYFPLFTGK